MRPKRPILAAGPVLSALLLGCGTEPVRLGPVDGQDLPRTEVERVGVGSVAPDFNLATYPGGVTSLTQYRGRPIILVFYRGHW